jgi:DNA-binding CsgD family transcriptional regulator
MVITQLRETGLRLHAMKHAARMLDCLAASYRLDLDAAAYLRNLVDEAAPLIERGLGIIGYTYDASDPADPIIDNFMVSSAFDTAWLPPYYAALAECGLDSGSRHPTGFAGWGHMRVGQATKVPAMRPLLPAFAHIGGARDTFALNARDASGRGLWLGAPMRSTHPVSADDTTLFSRLAAHLTSAIRLRRTTTRDHVRPAAVMSTSGTLLHADRDEAVEFRDDLRRAALAFDRARTRKARGDVELATRRWRPLVQSHWSLLDEFSTDGKRYIIAVDNGPPTPTPRGALSEREHQVLTQASLGLTNKEIAYELGLSSATVRVLLHRAARKLGVATRAEAIVRFAQLGAPATH